MQKIRCDIEGLDCPHCAAKLEGLLADHEAFGAAHLNFALGTLTLEVADEADEERSVAVANEVARAFDDNVSITLRD